MIDSLHTFLRNAVVDIHEGITKKKLIHCYMPHFLVYAVDVDVVVYDDENDVVDDDDEMMMMMMMMMIYQYQNPANALQQNRKIDLWKRNVSKSLWILNDRSEILG